MSPPGERPTNRTSGILTRSADAACQWPRDPMNAMRRLPMATGCGTEGRLVKMGEATKHDERTVRRSLEVRKRPPVHELHAVESRPLRCRLDCPIFAESRHPPAAYSQVLRRRVGGAFATLA